MSESPFSRRAALGIAVVCVLSFVGGLLLAILGTGEAPTSRGNDGFSRSAVGHRAFVRLFEELGVPVFTSRHASEVRAGRRGVVVLAEPDVEADRGRWGALRRIVGGAERVVLVLPKRKDDGLRPTESVQNLVDAVPELEGAVRRLDAPPTGGWAGAWSPTFAAGPVQVLESSDLQPVVWREEGILVGLAGRGAFRLLVVADPDLVANAGLHRGHNAEIVAQAIEMVRPEGGALVVDETLHGHTRVPSVWRELFAFPLWLVTAHAVLAVLVLLWAGTGRFGPAQGERPALERGSGLLLRNAADLLRRGRHPELVLHAYLREALARARGALRAPPRLSEAEAEAWLDAVAARRGVTTRVADLRSEVRETLAGGARPERVVAAARRIHSWKEGILHGTG